MATKQPVRAGRREWIGLAVLALACVLYSMDLTVLHLAVPQLSADLEPSSAQLLWIVDIYGFLLAGSLITMGTLGDRIGRRRHPDGRVRTRRRRRARDRGVGRPRQRAGVRRGPRRRRDRPLRLSTWLRTAQRRRAQAGARPRRPRRAPRRRAWRGSARRAPRRSSRS
jgi:hypothetical protein